MFQVTVGCLLSLRNIHAAADDANATRLADTQQAVPDVEIWRAVAAPERRYPGRLAVDRIPAAAIMSIAGIYDALTASDRPFKRDLPEDRAWDILSAEAGANKIGAAP